jgi:hypothetical protein
MHTSKRARILTYSKLHTSAIECREGLCISRLVDFELLLELKIEQKDGTSLVKLVVENPGYKQSVYPSQLFRVNTAHGSTRTSPGCPTIGGISSAFMGKLLRYSSGVSSL